MNYYNNKYCLLLILGFINGFSLLITGGSINYWITKTNINIEIIGLLSATTLPYAFNFLWAPIVDKYSPPIIAYIFGHRFGWIIILHLLMSILIYMLSNCNPEENIKYFSFLTFITSFIISTKDAIVNGWRTEITPKNKRGVNTQIFIIGYRIGFLVSGSGAIYLSILIGWNNIYKIYALTTLIFPIIIYFFVKNENSYIKETKIINQNNVIKTILNIKSLPVIIIFLLLYRLSDNLMSPMLNPFLLKLGFSDIEIASIGKILGLSGTIAGGFISGIIIDKTDLFTSLFKYSLLHSISHLLFLILIINKNIYLYSLITLIHSITSGMSMTAYIVYITKLSSGDYSATKYAFFSAGMGLSRSIFPMLSGYIVLNLGWVFFYCTLFILSIPTLIIIKYFLVKNDE